MSIMVPAAFSFLMFCTDLLTDVSFVHAADVFPVGAYGCSNAKIRINMYLQGAYILI